jgi:hypothetical protein
MILGVIRLILLVVGWGAVLLLDLRLNDEPDCIGVSEGNECPWRATGDFWAFLIFGMAAVAILVLPRRSFMLRLPVAAATFLIGAAIFFL